MQLKRPKAIENSWIVLETEEDSENNASFFVRTLTRPEMKRLRDYMYEPLNSTEKRLNAEGQYLAVRLGLLDWRNIQDEHGASLVFDGNWQNVFNLLPDYLIEMLAYEIWMRSFWTEDDEKKLSQQLKSAEIEKNSTATSVNSEDTATNQTPQASINSV